MQSNIGKQPCCRSLVRVRVASHFDCAALLTFLAVAAWSVMSAHAQGVRVGNCWTDYSGVNHCGPAETPRTYRAPTTGSTGSGRSAPDLLGHDNAGAQVFKQQGEALLERGKYAEAETAFYKAINRNWKDPALRGLLAQAAERQGKYELAVWQYKVQLELDPSNAGAQANIGHCYQLMGDRTRALAAYDKALGFARVSPVVKANIDSWMADINRQLAAEESARANKQAAERERREAAQRGKRTADFEASLKTKDITKAMAAVRSLDPREAAAIAESRMREGRLEEGKIAFTALVASLPPEKRLGAIAQFRDAVLNFSKNPADYVEVQRAFIAALPANAGDQRAREQTKLGYALMLSGQYPAASAEFQGALAQSRDPAFLARIGDALRQNLGETGVASLFYERALKLDPRNRAAAAGLAAAQGLAPGNPNRSPGNTPQQQPNPNPTGAFNQLGGVEGTARMADGPMSKLGALNSAFDQGFAPGSGNSIVLRGMPHSKGAGTPAQVPARYTSNPQWQQLRASEVKAEAAVDKAQHALEDAQFKLDSMGSAPPGETTKVQAEIEKRRSEVAKATEKLNTAAQQRRSYEVKLDEEPPPADGNSVTNPAGAPPSGNRQ